MLETIVSEANTKRIIHTLRFENFDYMLPINHKGGIWFYGTMSISWQMFDLKEHRAIHMLSFGNSI